MGKSKKAKRVLEKKISSSNGSSNPFDSIRRQTPKVSIHASKARRTKVVRRSAEDAIFSHTLPRRSQKLDLFNLNQPLSLTHNYAPIEDHYEDSVSENSEDDFRYNGEPQGFAQALQEHKQRRAVEKIEKSAQRELLSKLDLAFNDLDMHSFIRSRRGTPSISSNPATSTVSKQTDKFSENLRKLMAAPVQSRDGSDLLRQLYAAPDIKTKCEIAKKFMDNRHIATDTANKTIVEIARPLSALMSTQSGYQEFGTYIDTFTAFVHYLCQHSPKEYHAYFSNFLKGVYVSFEKADELSLEALIVLYLLIKVMKVGTALYRGGLIVLERMMATCAPEQDDESRVRLLIVTAYSSTLDSGLYMPFFFKLAMKICVSWHKSKPKAVDTVLDMVVVSLKLLAQRGCHVYPICLHIISPNIGDLAYSSPKLERLKTVAEQYSNVELVPNVLDVYKRPVVDLQVPNFDTKSSRQLTKDPTVKREKAQYKVLKREFIQTAAAEAKYRSLELQQRRAKTREKYRKVLRDAMVEQEELRKEFTKPT
ncbi:remorin family protein isoform 3, putative [Babesia ovis]|uniref:Remorin family protein isoform 3, putative n=1 Tax=Babesia ovis TaxID=5869 RepID=A0A9W5WUI6_BABOV|nr:remorin family protein isoform 3, putative [Babesia ovis]